MQIMFGKYDGRTSQEVVVKHASYAKWVLDGAASGSLGSLQTELKRLITTIDNKRYTCRCSASGCSRTVSRMTAYLNDDADLYPWCALCDPYGLGANSGKLTVVNGYRDVLNHVTVRCGATKGGYDRIVKAYARLKGLPARVSAASAAAFFE